MPSKEIKSPQLAAIVAMTPDGVIGNTNELPWHIPNDLMRFKQLTMDHPIIMGRLTFDSIGKVLPGRLNIVMSRSEPKIEKIDEDEPTLRFARTQNEALEIAAASHHPKNRDFLAFVIGGSKIYDMFYESIDTLYVTLVEASIAGDTYFPQPDWQNDFEIIKEEKGPKIADQPKLKYKYLVGCRKGK